jgi:hypothetical protein
MRNAMKLNPILSALALSASAMVATSSVALADNEAREAEILGLHQLCDKGDRRACVRFGVLLGENRELHEEWRRHHPEWWWWEKL